MWWKTSICGARKYHPRVLREASQSTINGGADASLALPTPEHGSTVSPGPCLLSPLLPVSLSIAGSISMIQTVVHSGVPPPPPLANSDGQEGVGLNDEKANNTNILWKESRKVGVLRNPAVKNLTLHCTNAKCPFSDGVRVAWQVQSC